MPYSFCNIAIVTYSAVIATSLSKSTIPKGLVSLIGKSKTSGGFTFNVYTHLYRTLVLPIICYSAGVWGQKEFPGLQQVQNQAMRAFMGLGRNTPICALEGDLGWAPVAIYTKCEVVKLWHRICTLPATRITIGKFFIG